jgi:cytosine/adenosine deaminase-related metal-dependent hydrolase
VPLKIAHGVWLSDAEADRLAAGAVIHCRAATWLGSGLADVRALRARGLNVGIGCDGSSCNNFSDPMGDPPGRPAAEVEAWPGGSAREALELATRRRRGAGAQADIGSPRRGSGRISWS